jgi:hypothetical protein
VGEGPAVPLDLRGEGEVQEDRRGRVVGEVRAVRLGLQGEEVGPGDLRDLREEEGEGLPDLRGEEGEGEDHRRGRAEEEHQLRRARG